MVRFDARKIMDTLPESPSDEQLEFLRRQYEFELREWNEWGRHDGYPRPEKPAALVTADEAPQRGPDNGTTRFRSSRERKARHQAEKAAKKKRRR